MVIQFLWFSFVIEVISRPSINCRFK